MESILEVKDLQKNDGDFAAVKGITFDIKEVRSCSAKVFDRAVV